MKIKLSQLAVETIVLTTYTLYSVRVLLAGLHDHFNWGHLSLVDFFEPIKGN